MNPIEYDLPTPVDGRQVRLTTKLHLPTLAAIIKSPAYDGVDGKYPVSDANALLALKQLLVHVYAEQTTDYTQSTRIEGKPSGRYYARQPSLQGIRKDARHTILEPFVGDGGAKLVDVDMSNAHVTLLMQWCDMHNVPATHLRTYCANKTETRKRVAAHIQRATGNGDDESSALAKQVFLKLLNGGTVPHYLKDCDTVTEFAQGVTAIHQAVADTYPQLHRKAVESSKAKGYFTTVLGTTCSYLMNHLENLVWHAMAESLPRGVCVTDHQFDGAILSVPAGTDVDALCKHITDSVQELTGFVMPFEQKPFDASYEVTPVSDEEVAELATTILSEITVIEPRPDLTTGFTGARVINEQFIKSVDFTDGVYLRSGTGTGKTQALTTWLRSQDTMPRVLYLCTRIRLTRSIYNRLSSELGADTVTHYSDISPSMQPKGVVVSTLESMHKCTGLFDYVVLDEFNSILHQTASGQFASALAFASRFTQVCNTARVIAMDGLLDDESVACFTKAIPVCKDIPRVCNVYQNKKHETMHVCHSLTYIDERVRHHVTKGDSIIIASDTKSSALKWGKIVEEYVKVSGRTARILVYTADAGDSERKALSDLESVPKGCKPQGQRILIYSPSVECGVSIQGDLFDVQFNLFTHREVSLTSCYQQLNRVRERRSGLNYLYAAKSCAPQAYDDIMGVLQQRSSDYTYNRSTGQLALLENQSHGIVTLPMSQLYVAVEVMRTKQISEFRARFIDQLHLQGYTVRQLVSEVRPEAVVKATSKALHRAAQFKNLVGQARAVEQMKNTDKGEGSVVWQIVQATRVPYRRFSLFTDKNAVKSDNLTRFLRRKALARTHGSEGPWIESYTERALDCLECDVTDSISGWEERDERRAKLAYGDRSQPAPCKILCANLLNIIAGSPSHGVGFPLTVRATGWQDKLRAYLGIHDVGNVMKLMGYRGKLTPASLVDDTKLVSFVRWVLNKQYGLSWSRIRTYSRATGSGNRGYTVDANELKSYDELGIEPADLDLEAELYKNSHNECDRQRNEFMHYCNIITPEPGTYTYNVHGVEYTAVVDVTQTGEMRLLISNEHGLYANPVGMVLCRKADALYD